MGADQAERRDRRTKVELVIDKYELSGLPEELERLWTADSNERYSLRELADFVNEQVLKAAMRDAGLQPIEGEVENFYRLLTEDNVSAGKRTEARVRLEQAGVDLNSMQEHFVSHQAVYAFLTERRGAVYQEEIETDERIDSAQVTIQRLEGRMESVADNTIHRLKRAGDMEIEEFSVIVSVDVVCDKCSSQYDAKELFKLGGCTCTMSE